MKTPLLSTIPNTSFTKLKDVCLKNYTRHTLNPRERSRVQI